MSYIAKNYEKFIENYMNICYTILSTLGGLIYVSKNNEFFGSVEKERTP